jgi:hypothetical protein
MDEALELRKILLRLANDFERHERAAATFTGETPDQIAWLSQQFARLASEGSVSISDLGASPGYKFTPAGYTRYLPQIVASRSSITDVPGQSAPSSDLDMGLLYRMMHLLGGFRTFPSSVINTSSFETVLGETSASWRHAIRQQHVNRHLEFLELSGLISVKAKLSYEDWAGIGLTLGGQNSSNQSWRTLAKSRYCPRSSSRSRGRFIL